jgi:hypothetical protein
MREFWRAAPIGTVLLVLAVIAIVAVGWIFLDPITSKINSGGTNMTIP